MCVWFSWQSLIEVPAKPKGNGGPKGAKQGPKGQTGEGFKRAFHSVCVCVLLSGLKANLCPAEAGQRFGVKLAEGSPERFPRNPHKPESACHR